MRNTLHAPTAISWFMDKMTVRHLQLQTAPLGAVKIYPAFPVLKGNTHTHKRGPVPQGSAETWGRGWI